MILNIAPVGKFELDIAVNALLEIEGRDTMRRGRREMMTIAVDCRTSLSLDGLHEEIGAEGFRPLDGQS